MHAVGYPPPTLHIASQLTRSALDQQCGRKVNKSWVTTATMCSSLPPAQSCSPYSSCCCCAGSWLSCVRDCSQQKVKKRDCGSSALLVTHWIAAVPVCSPCPDQGNTVDLSLMSLAVWAFKWWIVGVANSLRAHLKFFLAIAPLVSTNQNE